MRKKTFLRTANMLAAGLVMAALALSAAPARAGNYRTLTGQIGGQTPLWTQVYKPSGHPVGCGAAAWAIIYGYWKQYRGKGRLLDGVSMPHSQTRNDPGLSKAMIEIAGYLNSTYGTYQGKKWGRSMPNHMCGGKRYAQRRGYSVSCTRIRGTEFKKFHKVRAWLNAGKPVIILINNPAKAFSSLHYPIIEKAALKQKRVLRKWRDRDVSYYVNMAWGPNTGRKWIWVREVGRNTHRHTGSFSMFLIDIR